MGSSDKAVKIAVIAVLASAAAYLGYRAYKKRYPFENSDSRQESVETSNESNKSNIAGGCCSSNPESLIKEEKDVSLADKTRLEGNKAFKEGSLNSAIKLYDEAIELYPTDHIDLAFTYANRAACYLKLNRYDAVIDDCTKALSINPELLKALDRRSKAYENLGRLDEALVDVTAACIIDDFRTSSLVRRVESILKTLSTENAEKDFENKIFEFPSNSIIAEFFSTFPKEWIENEETLSENKVLSKAFKLIKERKFREALELSDSASEIGANQSKALSLKGSAQFIKGDIKSAQENFTKAHQLDQNDPNILIKLSLVELENNNFLKMDEFLEKAHKIDPENPSLYYHRGEIFALGGHLEEAISDFDRAIDLYPDFVLAHIHKARACLGLGRLDAAENVLRDAQKKFTDNIEIYIGLGEVLVMDKKFEAAEQIFESVLQKNPKSPEIFLNKALLAMTRNNDVAAAEKFLKKSIEIDPSFETGHLQLANLLISNGKVTESMVHFEHAVKYARTLQELISVHSLKCASFAQVKIMEKFPFLEEKIK